MNCRLNRMAGKTQLPGEPIVQTTKYSVNCLPEDGIDSHVFELTVEYRGDGRWGVYRNAHCCLGTDGTWSYGYAWRDGSQEPSSDEEWTEYHAGREAWLDAHRFDEETALRLAKEHAPQVTVNGITVRRALSRMVVEATPAREA
jgi:hypothetical protein